MNHDRRLSTALHVLLHMSELEGPATSEALAPIMKTNPVVFRRTMGGLREAGIVRSEKGHGGGWSLARGLDQITLADVYAALGTKTAFRIGHHDPKATCLLERGVNDAIAESLAVAEAVLNKRFASVTMADILTDVRSKSARKARKDWHGHA